jgi:hypothetical protein
MGGFSGVRGSGQGASKEWVVSARCPHPTAPAHSRPIPPEKAKAAAIAGIGNAACGFGGMDKHFRFCHYSPLGRFCKSTLGYFISKANRLQPLM